MHLTGNSGAALAVCASVSATLDRKMSTRWIYELATPGRPDISSVHASYAFADVVAIALLLARLTNFWP
jgi:hypothetical protein